MSEENKKNMPPPAAAAAPAAAPGKVKASQMWISSDGDGVGDNCCDDADENTNTNTTTTTNNNAAAASYLKAVASLETSLEYRQRNIKQLQLKPGQHVLDVGCGTGDDIIELIAPFIFSSGVEVGDGGRVVGVDLKYDLLQIAKDKVQKGAAEASSNNNNIEFFQCNILEDGLPFENETFDSVRSARVFQHLSNPEKALRECIRVLKPNGRIVISEPDWDTLVVDASTKEIFDIWDRMKKISIEHGLINGRMGIQLYRLFGGDDDSGLLQERQIYGDTIVITDFELVKKLGDLDRMIEQSLHRKVVTQDEVDKFLQDMEQKHRQGTYVTAITIFTVSGVKKVKT